MQEVVNGLVMQTRDCVNPKCNQTFRVNADSTQLYHSSFCESEDTKSADKKREWKKWIHLHVEESINKRNETEESGSKKESVCDQIQTTQKNIAQKNESDMRSDLRKKESEISENGRDIIWKTRKVKTEEEEIQGEGTVSEKTKTHESDIEKDMNISSSKLKHEEEEMIPRLDSTARLSLIALDVSESMNLLDSSAKQMKELMIKTGSSLDSLNRQISVRCAREAREAIRAKLEISKFVFRVASDKKNGDEKGAAYEQ